MTSALTDNADGELVNSVKKDFKSSIWSQSATLIGQILTTARHKPRNAANAVQQRLLNAVSDKDRSSSDTGKRKSIMGSQFRPRTVSGASGLSEEHKTSPLRTVITPLDDSSDGDAVSSDEDSRDNSQSLPSDDRNGTTHDTENNGQNGNKAGRSTRSLELAPSLLRKSISRSSTKGEPRST